MLCGFTLTAAQHKKYNDWLLLRLMDLITVLARLGTYFHWLSQTMHRVRIKVKCGFSQDSLRWLTPEKRFSETTWEMEALAPDWGSQKFCRLRKSCPPYARTTIHSSPVCALPLVITHSLQELGLLSPRHLLSILISLWFYQLLSDAMNVLN